MNNLFLEISLILAVATAISGLMLLLRQPLIIGHIITGLLIGPYLLNFIRSPETLEVFSHLGVALLLFVIGLSLNPRVIREVGKVAVITGLGQIIFTSGLGFLALRLLGFSTLVSLYLAIALTFSSTIIVLKLLSDKRELGQLYGKVATGFLLVQDIVAAVVLLVVAGSVQEEELGNLAAVTFVKLTLLLVSFIVLTRFLLQPLSRFFARSQEFLFLFAAGWGFGVAALFATLGLSFEIGALFAGVALAASPFSYEIASRMRPLRDFFIVVFFILLGARMSLGDAGEMLFPALALSGFILLGNPLIVMALMGFLGYTKKTSFKAGLTVAQISEFSLILIVLGNRVGHLSDEMISLVTIVGLVTIAVSTYFILYADALYERLAPLLGVFERRRGRHDDGDEEAYPVILFGYRRAGYRFVETLKGLDERFLIVDFDPTLTEELSGQGIASRYGDATDSEFLEELELGRVKLVISTISDAAANALIAHHVRKVNRRAVLILSADDTEKAEELYEHGATYVLMPHYEVGEGIRRLIAEHEWRDAAFAADRHRHREYLSGRSRLSSR